MTIACPKCGRAHALPDGSSDNKRLFFLCSQCKHKVVVDGRKKFVTGTVGTAAVRETSPKPAISHILDSTACLFSVPSFLLTLLFSLAAFLLIGVVSFVVVRNISFFTANPAILAAVIGTTAFLVLYGYSVLLYLIAKIRYYLIDHPSAGATDWKFILFDLPEDAVTLLLLFVCVPLIIAAISAPVYFLGEWGVLYSGFAFPVLLCFSFVCILLFAFFRTIPAIIAGKSFYIRQSIASLISFVLREALNIPVYLILIDLITFVVSVFVLSFVLLAAFLSLAGLGSLLDPSFAGQLKTGIPAGAAQLIGLLSSGTLSFPVKTGIILLALFLLLTVLTASSFVITVRQNLTAQACWIMHTNPGKSVPRYITLLIIAGLGVIFFGFTIFPFIRLLAH